MRPVSTGLPADPEAWALTAVVAALLAVPGRSEDAVDVFVEAATEELVGTESPPEDEVGWETTVLPEPSC